ncbi:MAG: hypothetical protein AABW67_03940 [Nanoarchaeota archaeon]|mgnify:CR=1 FL=1
MKSLITICLLVLLALVCFGVLGCGEKKEGKWFNIKNVKITMRYPPYDSNENTLNVVKTPSDEKISAKIILLARQSCWINMLVIHLKKLSAR